MFKWLLIGHIQKFEWQKESQIYLLKSIKYS